MDFILGFILIIYLFFGRSILRYLFNNKRKGDIAFYLSTFILFGGGMIIEDPSLESFEAALFIFLLFFGWSMIRTFIRDYTGTSSKKPPPPTFNLEDFMLDNQPSSKSASPVSNFLKPPKLPQPATPSVSDVLLKNKKIKLCPYCAEEIKQAAIVCKHCGRELPGFEEAT